MVRISIFDEPKLIENLGGKILENVWKLVLRISEWFGTLKQLQRSVISRRNMNEAVANLFKLDFFKEDAKALIVLANEIWSQKI